MLSMKDVSRVIASYRIRVSMTDRDSISARVRVTVIDDVPPQ